MPVTSDPPAGSGSSFEPARWFKAISAAGYNTFVTAGNNLPLDAPDVNTADLAFHDGWDTSCVLITEGKWLVVAYMQYAGVSPPFSTSTFEVPRFYIEGDYFTDLADVQSEVFDTYDSFVDAHGILQGSTSVFSSDAVMLVEMDLYPGGACIVYGGPASAFSPPTASSSSFRMSMTRIG